MTLSAAAVCAGYDDVEEAPKLKRVQEDHWSVIVDEMRVNSQPVIRSLSVIVRRYQLP